MHFDKVKTQDILRAFESLANTRNACPDVRLDVKSEHGSRTHRISYEVELSGEGERHRRNAANAGSTGRRAATRDDWGNVIAALYELDHSAKIGPYNSRAEFHAMTNNAYLPWPYIL
jgi:hypothetical protein